MNIIKVKLSELKPDPNNARKHSLQNILAIKQSLQENPQYRPFVVQKGTNKICVGNGMYTAMQELGIKEGWVEYRDLDDKQFARLSVADNRTAELAEWDEDILQQIISDCGDDMAIPGFGDDVSFNLGDDKKITEDEDEVPAVSEDVVSVLGDVWILGRHRLMCGDATDTRQLKRLLLEGLADMVFTDPPYNVDYTGGTGLKIINDKMSDDKFYRFLFDAYKAMFDSVVPGGAIYVCHADSEGLNFRKALIDAGWLLKQCIIWVKSSLVMGRQDYQWKHEPILYGWKPGAAHQWNGGRKQTTVINETAGVTIKPDSEGFILSFDSGLQILSMKIPSYEILYSGADNETTTWRIEKPHKNGEHPTMKPVSLVSRAIANSCKPGGTVLDVFGGSGSTLIACEQLDRTCYMMELDPKYVDVIIKRWQNLTGKQAINETTKQIFNKATC